jgi:3-polyprenyl-4-hydroxybenzoate decarboxylase
MTKNGRLIEIDALLSPRVEIAEIQRQFYARQGTVFLLSVSVKGPSKELLTLRLSGIDWVCYRDDSL